MPPFCFFYIRVIRGCPNYGLFLTSLQGTENKDWIKESSNYQTNCCFSLQPECPKGFFFSFVIFVSDWLKLSSPIFSRAIMVSGLLVLLGLTLTIIALTLTIILTLALTLTLTIISFWAMLSFANGRSAVISGHLRSMRRLLYFLITIILLN